MYGRSIAFVMAILFCLGALGHLHGPTLALMLAVTPAFSVLAMLLVIVPALVRYGWIFAAWVALAWGLIFAAAAIGGTAGTVFSDCVYGPTLGWAWRGVPLIFALNWVLVINGLLCLAVRWVPLWPEFWRPAAIVLATGVLAVAFGWIMEPVANRLQYWRWTGGAVPPLQHAAVFIVAMLAAAFHPRHNQTSTDLGTTGRLAALFVSLQALFFGALRLAWNSAGS